MSHYTQGMSPASIPPSGGIRVNSRSMLQYHTVDVWLAHAQFHVLMLSLSVKCINDRNDNNSVSVCLLRLVNVMHLVQDHKRSLL